MTQTWTDLGQQCDRLTRMLLVNAHENHLLYNETAPDTDDQVKLTIEMALLAEEIERRQFASGRICPEVSLLGSLTTLELEVGNATRASQQVALHGGELTATIRSVRKSVGG